MVLLGLVLCVIQFNILFLQVRLQKVYKRYMDLMFLVRLGFLFWKLLRSWSLVDGVKEVLFLNFIYSKQILVKFVIVMCVVDRE